jgi:hypothetical protein
MVTLLLIDRDLDPGKLSQRFEVPRVRHGLAAGDLPRIDARQLAV